MPAFNNRFEPATIAGIPLYGFVFAVCSFVSLVLIFLIPMVFFTVIFAGCFISFAALSVYFFWLGDEIFFRKDILNARREKNLTTSDFDYRDGL